MLIPVISGILVRIMKNFLQRNKALLLAALILSVLFCYPYLFNTEIHVGHDLLFHLSRIEGLAERIRDFDFFPAVYPYKNNSFGYASSLFYCDFLLLIPAVLYNCGIALIHCYKILIFLLSFFSCFSMMNLLKRITDRNSIAILAGTAYLFANYHISDVFVRCAEGEIAAIVFLPVLLSGLYEILQKRNTRQWPLLTLGLAGLLLSHNLTFMLAIAVCILLFISYLTRMHKDIFISLCKGCFFAFLLTAFFTLPMLEQMADQQFLVSETAKNRDLTDQAMNLWQFFANTTVLGGAGNSGDASTTMLENVGWFLTFMPLCWLFVKKDIRKEHGFVTRCLILGYCFLIFPSSYFPWDSMKSLRILQFPWRLSIIAMVLLCVPACSALAYMQFSRKKMQKWLVPALTVILCMEGAWHLYPVYHSDYTKEDSLSYEELMHYRPLEYWDTWRWSELCGGEYLPLSSPNYLTYSTRFKDDKGNDLNISSERDGTDLYFDIEEKYTDQLIELPVTYYKGYEIYLLENGTRTSVSTFASDNGLVAFNAEKSGSYVCTYQHTYIQIGSLAVSVFTLAVLMMMLVRKKKQTESHTS